jgi:hypothetical protein
MTRIPPHIVPRSVRAHPLLASIAVMAALLLAGASIAVFIFTDPLLNHFAKGRIEEAFADAYPGFALRIGTLHYSYVNNNTECRGVLYAASDSSITCSARSISIIGIGWRQLVAQRELTPEVVKHSVVVADDIVLRIASTGYEIHCGAIRVSIADSEITARSALMEFKNTRYRLRCGTFRAAARDSECSAEDLELAPLAGDDDFFHAQAFRRTRFMLTIAKCRLRGAPVAELLQGKILTARSLEVVKPQLGLLVDRDKFSDPKSPAPLMPGEALARLKRTFRLDTLALHDGKLVYAERLDEKGKPGVITFESVELAAFGISNSGRATAHIRGHGKFMNAGIMSVEMHVTLPPRGISLSYTGSLTAMDAAALNQFLPITEHVRIARGMIRDASFEVSVAQGRGAGRLTLRYDDLYITMLDEQTGKKDPLGKRLATFVANLIKIRGSNRPDKRGSMKIGRVDYQRDPTDTFMNIAWLSLRSAVQDVVGF